VAQAAACGSGGGLVIIPTTYLSALLPLILSMLCWGTWANTQKMGGKWRFELFYYDFTWGILIAAAVAAFTFGSFDQQELTFQDNFLLAGYRKMAWAFGSGVVFNLANMFLVATIAVAGMSVAFPMAIGLALIVGVGWNYSLNPQTDPVLLFAGAAVILAAVCAAALAYSFHIDDQNAAAQQALSVDPRARNAPKKAGAAKGVVLAIVAGLIMGAVNPMIDTAKSGETGVAPYGLMLLFATGVLVSTAVYVPFFLSFPVMGKPLPVSAYFRGSKGQHVLGILGGIIWMTGGVSNLVAASSPALPQIGPAVSYALSEGAPLLAAFWGLFTWREFKGSTLRVKMVLTAMIVLFLAGLGVIAVAPLQGR
jgi:glucose uptake protein